MLSFWRQKPPGTCLDKFWKCTLCTFCQGWIFSKIPGYSILKELTNIGKLGRVSRYLNPCILSRFGWNSSEFLIYYTTFFLDIFCTLIKIYELFKKFGVFPITWETLKWCFSWYFVAFRLSGDFRGAIPSLQYIIEPCHLKWPIVPWDLAHFVNILQTF